jgi:hypothetical protein
MLRACGDVSQGIRAFSRRLFEIPLQFLKRLNLLPNGREPLVNKVSHMRTRLNPLILNEKKLSDLCKREPELLRLSDKKKVLNVPFVIEPKSTLASRRLAKKPLLLVKRMASTVRPVP